MKKTYESDIKVTDVDGIEHNFILSLPVRRNRKLDKMFADTMLRVLEDIYLERKIVKDPTLAISLIYEAIKEGKNSQQAYDSVMCRLGIEIKENLIAQLTGAVKWTQTVQSMVADGATTFTEVGPGKVLQGLVQKIHKETVVDGVA